MFRAIPEANKLCSERLRQKDMEMQRQRLKAMKPQVDTTVPGVVHLTHLKTNLKREQLLEERYFEIDRENKILLQKMSDIMRHTTYKNERPKSGGASLNRDHRKNELTRVTNENNAILKRIQTAQPEYNHVKWEDDFQNSEVYLVNKNLYPEVHSRPGSKRNMNKTRMSMSGGLLVGTKPSTASPDMARSPASTTRSSPALPKSAPSDIDENLKYVLKEGKKIDSIYYLIEMVTDGRTLAISAYDGDAQRTLELLVSEKNHRSLYRDSDGDYNLVAERLRVAGGQLILDRLGEEA